MRIAIIRKSMSAVFAILFLACGLFGQNQTVYFVDAFTAQAGVNADFARGVQLKLIHYLIKEKAAVTVSTKEDQKSVVSFLQLSLSEMMDSKTQIQLGVGTSPNALIRGDVSVEEGIYQVTARLINPQSLIIKDSFNIYIDPTDAYYDKSVYALALMILGKNPALADPAMQSKSNTVTIEKQNIDQKTLVVKETVKVAQEYLIVDFNNTVFKIRGELYIDNKPFAEYGIAGQGGAFKYNTNDILYLEPVYNRITKINLNQYTMQDPIYSCMIKSGTSEYSLKQSLAIVFASRLADEAAFIRQFPGSRKSEPISATGSIRYAVYSGKEFLYPNNNLPWTDPFLVSGYNFSGFVGHNEIAYVIPSAYLIKLKSGFVIHYVAASSFSMIPGWESRVQVVFFAMPSQEKSAKEEYDRITSDLSPENPLYFDKIPDANLGRALRQMKRERLIYTTELDLSNKQIENTAGLEKLINLKKLNLSENKIDKIGSLGQLVNLAWLSMDKNRITKIEGLEKLTGLGELRLSGNSINRIEGLDNLGKLGLLDLSRNQLAKIEGLDRLPNLQLLFLGNNKITAIEGLDHCPGLRNLNISANKLATIEGLDNLTNLEELLLSSNQLTVIEGLDKQTALKTLWIDGNQFALLRGIEKLTNLEYLNVGSNQIISIRGVEQLPKLSRLRIVYNGNLKDADELKEMKQLVELHILATGISMNTFADWQFSGTLEIKDATYRTVAAITQQDKAAYYIDKGLVRAR